MRDIAPSDLLPHREHVHNSILAAPLHESENWRRRFWCLLSKAEGKQVVVDFKAWRVLQVQQQACAGGDKLVTVEEAKTTVFSLLGTDQSWRAQLSELLLKMGLLVLANEHIDSPEDMELLQHHLYSGDEGLCNVLVHAKAAHVLGRLNPSDYLSLLMYFSTRKEKPQSLLDTLRQLPFFLRADCSAQRGGKYVHLGLGKRFICLRNVEGMKVDHTGNLVRLAIPGVLHLAEPHRHELRALYKAFRIRMCTTVEYVADFVCPFLKTAALGRDFEALEPVLHEIQAWVLLSDEGGHTAWKAKVVEAARSVKFVRAAAGDLCMAADLVDPNLDVVCAFRPVLQHMVPCEQHRVHLPLLQELGLRSSLSPELILACARSLDTEADGGGELSEATKQRSRLLVEAIFSSLAELLKKELQSEKQQLQQLTAPGLQLTAEDETGVWRSVLEQAAQLRVALVHNMKLPESCRKRIKQLLSVCSVERPGDPQPVRLAPLGGTLLDSEAETVAWTQRDVLSHPKGAYLAKELAIVWSTFSSMVARAVPAPR
eukprot:2299369-Prymnesium_polylepis.1